ncbi:hypothetical protein FJT64_007006 [Amphibalanus amphitrite]|uniref:GDNF/GAS1 domain-containing protein n=1 Tax=Amphibalanus amphitrite TaxID=1232801 RepID=A0A6A4W014_AMPAM|nr:hypothetical protein FJT64_007006 [Amphibalanus amphitrite]
MVLAVVISQCVCRSVDCVSVCARSGLLPCDCVSVTPTVACCHVTVCLFVPSVACCHVTVCLFVLAVACYQVTVCLFLPSVACSTVTVTKCTAALRTLVAFQFFQPTCLCKEPRIDPECNKYRNLVFDHPCYTVKQKDKDPYPVHALPTCGYALDACRRQAHCSRLYDNFINSCDFRDNRCLMTNSRACYNAWNQLRLSPVFGCICPDSTAACQQIFDLVHRNPCVVDVLAGGDWDASRRPVDPLLVTPLVDLTSEPTYNSSLTETLYGSTDPFGARGHGGGRSHQPTRTYRESGGKGAGHEIWENTKRSFHINSGEGSEQQKRWMLDTEKSFSYILMCCVVRCVETSSFSWCCMYLS